MRPPRPSRVNRRSTGTTLLRLIPSTIVVRNAALRVRGVCASFSARSHCRMIPMENFVHGNVIAE
jgi:hypothetical protein